MLPSLCLTHQMAGYRNPAWKQFEKGQALSKTQLADYWANYRSIKREEH